MNTAELINKLLDRADGSLDQLKLHYGPLIRYVITPILSDGGNSGGFSVLETQMSVSVE